MGNRLPVLVFGLIALGIIVVAGTFAIVGGPGTALGGGTTLTKVPDSETVNAGSQVGYTLHFVYDGTGTLPIFIEDDLPIAAGMDWEVESFSGAATCEITGTNPPHLECIGESSDNGSGEITVHIISPTTPGVCGTLVNNAAAGGQNESDVFAEGTIVVNCPTVTPTPSPSPTASPTASPSPSPTESPITPAIDLMGGFDDDGHNVIIDITPPDSSLRFIDYNIPVYDPCVASAFSGPADTQTGTVDLADVPISGGHFSKSEGLESVTGDITGDGDTAFAEGDVTVAAGTACERTTHFQAAPPGRALLDGDIDCSWVDQFLSAAGGVAQPQGPTPPPDPAKAITIRDVFETLKWVAGLAEDSPPLNCPHLGDLLLPAVTATPGPSVTPTPGPQIPKYWGGDADCTSEISPNDAFELLKYMVALDQPSCGGVKVGHFFLLDR